MKLEIINTWRGQRHIYISGAAERDGPVAAIEKLLGRFSLDEVRNGLVEIECDKPFLDELVKAKPEVLAEDDNEREFLHTYRNIPIKVVD